LRPSSEKKTPVASLCFSNVNLYRYAAALSVPPVLGPCDGVMLDASDSHGPGRSLTFTFTVAAAGTADVAAAATALAAAVGAAQAVECSLPTALESAWFQPSSLSSDFLVTKRLVSSDLLSSSDFLVSKFPFKCKRVTLHRGARLRRRRRRPGHFAHGGALHVESSLPISHNL
jgi:hypothetical protein